MAVRVKNPGPHQHRVGGYLFPVGEIVVVDDPVIAEFVVKEMRFEVVPDPKPIADGSPVTKPAKGVRK